MSETGPNTIAIIFVVAIVHFLPTIVALLRGHRQAFAIVVLNLLLGWTLIGWVAALVWAVTNQSAREKAE